jgi:hypothetical protein
MPIRPENKDRYPANWSTEIVPAIRERSGNRCECLGECGTNHETALSFGNRCTARNGEIGYWDEWGVWQRYRPLFDGPRKTVKIVLTVAHRDHTPENVDPANLFHACQRCHNRYDAPMRRAGIKARARAQRASGDLFQCQETI